MLRAFRIIVAVQVGLLCLAASAQDAEADFAALSSRFEAAIAQQRWDEALSLAERAVSNLRASSTREPSQLIEALSRLGAVQALLKDFAAAETSYEDAIALTETDPGLSGRAVEPLRGLAGTLIATGQHERAISVLEHAVRVGSRAEGIFGSGQVEVLKLLAEAQTQMERFDSAEQTLKYFVQVHEHAFGPKDSRTLAARVSFADWYTYAGELASARSLLRSCIEEAEENFGKDSAELIAPLRGLGRSYMAQLLYGPRIVGKLTDSKDTNSVWIGHSVRGYVPPQWLRREDVNDPQALEGESALTRALGIAERTSAPRSEVLVLLLNLGDWFEFKHDPRRALDYYRRADALASSPTESVPAANLFEFPVNIYLPPVPTEGGRPNKGRRYALIEYSVTAEGSTEGARIVESNASDRELARVLRVVDRALYRPRFVNHEPVPTEGLRYRFVF